jgi:hypothetical protein
LVCVLDSPDCVADVVGSQVFAAPQPLLHLLQDAGGPADGVGLPAEAQLIIAGHHAHAQRLADHPQVSVRRPEERQLFARFIEGDG